MNIETMRELINDLNGKIFHVTFVKKDGTLRKMTARTGVKKHLQGGELAYDPIEKGLLSVYDMENKEGDGYRMINLSTITEITMAGKTWRFEK